MIVAKQMRMTILDSMISEKDCSQSCQLCQCFKNVTYLNAFANILFHMFANECVCYENTCFSFTFFIDKALTTINLLKVKKEISGQ